jgi:hypothetical protein
MFGGRDRIGLIEQRGQQEQRPGRPDGGRVDRIGVGDEAG